MLILPIISIVIDCACWSSIVRIIFISFAALLWCWVSTIVTTSATLIKIVTSSTTLTFSVVSLVIHSVTSFVIVVFVHVSLNLSVNSVIKIVPF